MADKLRAPIKELLDTSLDELRAQRMWRGLQQRPVRTSAARMGWLAGAAGVLALALLFVLRTPDPGPLLARGASAITFDQPRTVLSDGSRIELAADARLKLLENNGQTFALQLERGRARFEVTPGGPRRWHMECGLASVAVVGTALTIERAASTLRVEVSHGVVEVRGARVPNGMQRLTAGQALSIDGDRHDLPPPQLSAAAPAPDTPAARWLIEADLARQRGDHARALAVLQKLLREQPGTSEAGIAGFTLARMQMEQDPRAAVAALRASLAAATPASLREDALARLVEAYARVGEPALARRTAAEYRRQYPDGRRLAEVERWAAQP